jgi:ATP-dependent RNA/DNA helicase IGHMBP2
MNVPLANPAGRQAYDSAEHDEHQHTPLSIGVIAPYRAQINYLKDAIEDSEILNGLLLQRRLSVGTVDSFQGQDRDISATSSPSP